MAKHDYEVGETFIFKSCPKAFIDWHQIGLTTNVLWKYPHLEEMQDKQQEKTLGTAGT